MKDCSEGWDWFLILVGWGMFFALIFLSLSFGDWLLS